MHHAYYIEGSLAQFDEYKAALKPFWAYKCERFGVEDARELVALASLKHAEQLFFVALSSITTEAQQALLKLFEEPQAGTTFVLLLPHGVLLPTLRSRMLEYPSRRISSQKTTGTAAFLKSNSKARSDIITAMLKDEEGTKERVREFVDALELELHKKMKDEKVRAGLADIAMVRDYLRDRSPSIKMLLEHLAVCLPQS